jgi:ribosome-associated protein
MSGPVPAPGSGWLDRPVAQTEDVEVGPEGIRLGQLLKYVNAVETGGEAKDLLASGEVEVNGEVETRRGAQLHPGDVVSLPWITYRIS